MAGLSAARRAFGKPPLQGSTAYRQRLTNHRGFTLTRACLRYTMYSNGKEVEPMANSVLPIRLDAQLKKRLTAKARASGRTVSEQVRYYALLAMITEENPDLPLSMIQDILEGRAQAKEGLFEPYPWGVL